jgi:CHAT domain-containing protein
VEALRNIAQEQHREIAVYLRDDVREQTVKSLSARGALKQYHIIHFVCHGYFNEDEPGASGIGSPRCRSPTSRGTSFFMDALYRRVLGEGKTFRVAYYEVKNDFRHDRFGAQYTRPMYWAAFTMYE